MKKEDLKEQKDSEIISQIYNLHGMIEKLTVELEALKEEAIKRKLI